jgi:VWFA-related protein
MQGYASDCFKSPYLAVLAALVYLGLAAAQSIAPDEMRARTVPYVPPAPVTLRTEVNVVDVPVVVRDGQRRAVAGLTRDDFEIYDSGKKQTITAFSVQHFASQGDAGGGTKPAAIPAAPADAAGPKSDPRPRFIALCFDDLHTGAANLKAAKDAAERFVRTSLAPGDRVAVVTAAPQSQKSEFIGDVPKLVERIAKVNTRERTEFLSCPTMQAYEAYLIANRMDRQLLDSKIAECSACQHNPCPEGQVTSLAESVWNRALLNTKTTLQVLDSLVDGMANLPGQRIVLLTSAEFFMGNLETDVDRLMAKALHAEVVINTLDAKRLNAVLSPRTEGRMQDAKNDGMAVLASGTGGAFYHNGNDLAGGFRELGMAPETMYILGFTPSEVAADGRFHSLKVRLAGDKRYSLQARLGYTDPKANSSAPVSPLSKLDREVMATDTIADLPVAFTWERKTGPPGITMVAHLDVNRLHFQIGQDRRAQKLTIIGVLLDSSGNFVTGKRSEFDLNLTEATFAQLAKTSFTASMNIEVPPGSYSVRALAQDALEGKLAAAGGTVQVK